MTRERFLSTGCYAPTRDVGADTSARALRLAARAHDRAAAVAWDVFRPFPLTDGTADVVLDVFAPRNPAEFHRVLRPTGRLIVVRPTGRHLAKEERLHRAPTSCFEAVVTEGVEYSAALSGPDVRDRVAMTPSARRVSRADLDGAGTLPYRVTVSVPATAYRIR